MKSVLAIKLVNRSNKHFYTASVIKSFSTMKKYTGLFFGVWNSLSKLFISVL